MSQTTTPAAHAAARSVTAIAFNQLAQVAGSVLFVALVPRLLGAEVYGQLAFAFAFITIVQMIGELGYQEIFSRFLPEVRRTQGDLAARGLARRLLAVRLGLGLALGLLAALTAPLAAAWLTPTHVVLIALSVVARVWAMGPFALLLGLGETLKWSVETTWRQIAVTVLTLLLVRAPSLTLALLAMTLHEVVFLILGTAWVTRYLLGTAVLAAPLLPYLRFGFTFSLANLALVVLFRISPITVEKLTASHPETGYFDLALGGLLLLYTLLGQVAYAFVPILTHLTLDRRDHEADVWLGRVVRYSAMLVALALGGMWAVAAPLAPALFGSQFAGAAGAIRIMAFGLLPLPLAWAGVLLSAVDKRPRRKLWAALVALAVFVLAAWLFRRQASAGVALAFALALAGYALGFGLATLRVLRAGGSGWLFATLAALVFAPLFFSRFDSLLLAFVAWGALAALYLALMLLARALRLAEARALVAALRRRLISPRSPSK
jgi:O-antigen/teichoic acid export membrane protein